MNAVPYCDELVREYILWRGFTNCFEQFDIDKRADRFVKNDFSNKKKISIFNLNIEYFKILTNKYYFILFF